MSETYTGFHELKSQVQATRAKILCVDDQEANLLSLRAALRRDDYELVEAHSGAEALLQVLDDDFAVILLDVQMPVMDGFETARRMRQNERSQHTPIIFLTAGFPSEERALQGYGAGAVDYLFKPLNIEMLKAKVSVFVDLFRQARLLRALERREADRALEEFRENSARKYQNLVEGIRDGIVWSASPAERRFTFMSRRAEEITGYPLSRWVSEPELIRRCLDAETLTRFAASVDVGLEEGHRLALEHRFIKANGETMWFHTEVHAERDLDSGDLEIRGLSVDITHLKETERALRAAVSVRDEFLSIASHELKTPITPLQLQMQGFIRMIETDKLDRVPIEKLRYMLEISDAQVNRLSRLIGQLLDVSRINEGRLMLDLERASYNEAVDSVLSQLQHDLASAECQVILEMQPEVQGCFDRLRFEQVLINLISNSVKYAAGAPIQISLSSTDGEARISVRDRGMGIAPADQGRIFERFERAVPLKNYGGLGLGLYIARQIVELHHGSISVQSELGQGATFLVRLPLDPAEAEQNQSRH